jgi:hypothetical protein
MPRMKILNALKQEDFICKSQSLWCPDSSLHCHAQELTDQIGMSVTGAVALQNGANPAAPTQLIAC